MNENLEAVGPLKKINLLLEAGARPDRMDLTPEPIPFEFIFGAGSRGLSPFEFQLANKKAGESFSMHVAVEEISDLFGHLPIPSWVVPKSMHSFYLKVRTLKVSEPDPREVIKALAEAGSCGDHCCSHEDKGTKG